MGIMHPQNKQMKSIVLAFCGSIIAAVGTMLVPTSMLESITGATGLSELVPATAAPLGDTARALIAFGTGIVALIVLLAVMLRKKSEAAGSGYNSPGDIEADKVNENIGERLSEFKERFSGIRLPQMPWQRREDDILDLADLPKLREHDAHPDAPARRPISALSDLADADLTGAPLPDVSKPGATPVKTPDLPVAEPVQPPQATPVEVPIIVAEPVAEPVSDPVPVQPSVPEPAPSVATENMPLSAMVAQLEAAVEARKIQLEKLEAEVAQLTGEKANDVAVTTEPVATEPLANTSAAVAQAETPSVSAPVASEAALATRPPLEAVPDAPRSAEDDEMDAALNAALETLQKMNSAAR